MVTHTIRAQFYNYCICTIGLFCWILFVVSRDTYMMICVWFYIYVLKESGLVGLKIGGLICTVENLICKVENRTTIQHSLPIWLVLYLSSRCARYPYTVGFLLDCIWTSRNIWAGWAHVYNVTRVPKYRGILNATWFHQYRFMCKPLYTEIEFLWFSSAHNSIQAESSIVAGWPVNLDSSWIASGPVQISGLGVEGLAI